MPLTKAKRVNYEKLRVQFGCSSLTDERGAALVERLERLTEQPAHPLLRRGIFFAHRNLETILDRYEQGKPFYLYIRTPGTKLYDLHLGHLVPFMLTKYLQEVFNVPLVIQVVRYDKQILKRFPEEKVEQYASENIKDILSVGFDPASTFVFTGENIFDKPSQPFLMPVTMDQDSLFRMMRDEAALIEHPAPSGIYGQFLPSLSGGIDGKMSSSLPFHCIYLSDRLDQVEEKIGKSFSGGKETLKQHRDEGGDCEVDVAFQMLRFFLNDDQQLEEIRQKYTSGDMTTGEMKAKAIETIAKLLARLRKNRRLITDKRVEEFTRIRDFPRAG